MTKLHEILAVEGSLEKAAMKLIAESKKTFQKESLFKGLAKTLEMFSEEDKKSETSEYQELTTTVDENLDWIIPPIAKWFDTVLIKEKTNQKAEAQIVLEGKVVSPALPATFLLGMETKLGRIRELYEQIPTLPPGVAWVPDELSRPGVYKSKHDAVQLKTKKDIDFRVVVKATPEHPAQVKEVPITKDVGRFVSVNYNGMMTPKDKAERLARIDKLLHAVKKARMRANNIETERGVLGHALLNYINTGAWE